MENNSLKYDQVFVKIFGNKINSFTDFKFKVSPQWDSMSQIALVSAIEDTFNIEFDFEDIFVFNSYENGKKLLSDKFEINF